MDVHEQAVVEVVRKQFGEPASVRFAETWGPRVVAEVVVNTMVVFVKAAGDADVRAEGSVLATVRSAGVPVPELLARGEHPGLPGGHWIATRRAPGEPWRIDESGGRMRLPATFERTLKDIAEAFGRLHRIRPRGFGPVASSGVGSHSSWAGWLRDEARQCLDGLADAGHVTEQFHRHAVAAFDRWTPTIPQGSLVHGDLGNSETFVRPDSGELTCMVDWGGTIIGDPIFEFARFNAGGPADDPRPEALLPPLLAHYTAETGIESERIERVLPLYHAHNAITNAAWSLREGVPWVRDLLAKAEALLERVES